LKAFYIYRISSIVFLKYPMLINEEKANTGMNYLDIWMVLLEPYSL